MARNSHRTPANFSLADHVSVVDDESAPVAVSLSAIEAELQRRRFTNDPVEWARVRLGDVLWSGQRRILAALASHRRVAAVTCHGIGKSYDAGIAAAWWIDIHPPGQAFVVTTAPTDAQVRVILWKEIGRVHARGGLAGTTNQTEWKQIINGKEETVAMGRKPSDYSPTAFQGIHAPYVLVIVDEANGVRGALWEPIHSMVANDYSKILLIGNPDDPSGEFFDACKPGSGWHIETVSAFDSPNFTNEPLPESIKSQLIGRTYVEERRAKYASTWRWVEMNGKTRCVPPEGETVGNTHPFWQSKVLGQFPVQSTVGTLIPLSWIQAAQERDLDPDGPDELGLDVGASEKGDPSCLGRRRGPVFRILYEERQPDTMKTTGRLIQHLRSTGATCAKVDYIGVGRGVVDRSREQSLPVYPISVGDASTVLSCLSCRHEWDSEIEQTERCPKCDGKDARPVFANMLSQLWWAVRGLFERGEIDIDPKDEDLAGELLTLSWAPNSKGQTVVSYGKGPSPNRADALMISFARTPVLVNVDDSFVSW